MATTTTSLIQRIVIMVLILVSKMGRGHRDDRCWYHCAALRLLLVALARAWPRCARRINASKNRAKTAVHLTRKSSEFHEHKPQDIGHWIRPVDRIPSCRPDILFTNRSSVFWSSKGHMMAGHKAALAHPQSAARDAEPHSMWFHCRIVSSSCPQGASPGMHQCCPSI